MLTTNPPPPTLDIQPPLQATTFALVAAAPLAFDDQPLPESGGLARWQVHRLELLMARHLAEPISVAYLAAAVRLSRSHFARAFKCSFGEAPYSALRRRRIERAKLEMLETNEPLSQIALTCGFADQSHLSRCFRAYTGEAPLRWRRKHTRGPR